MKKGEMIFFKKNIYASFKCFSREDAKPLSLFFGGFPSLTVQSGTYEPFNQNEINAILPRPVVAVVSPGLNLFCSHLTGAANILTQASRSARF